MSCSIRWVCAALVTTALGVAATAGAQTLTVGNSGNSFGPASCNDSSWGGASGHTDAVVTLNYAYTVQSTGTLVSVPTLQLFVTQSACPAVDSTNNTVTVPSDAITLVQAGTQVDTSNPTASKTATVRVSQLAQPDCATPQNTVWNACFYEFFVTQSLTIGVANVNGSGSASLQLTYDSLAPGAPRLDSVDPGDSHVRVGFTPPSDTDIQTFQVLIAPLSSSPQALHHPRAGSDSGSDSGSTGAGSDSGSSGSGGDSGSSGSTGSGSDSGSTGSGSSSGSSGSTASSSSGSTTGETGFTATACNPAATVMANFGSSVSSGTVPDDSSTLVNGETYVVQVRAVDKAGNVGPCSNEAQGTPQVINDFWRLYKGDGGETDGGCAQAGGTVALLGLLGVAFGLGRARRRDRQEKE
jgi:hypothetical protein